MGKAELEQLETWATSAIEAATGIVGEREIARHLASQASADATRKACFELLGRAPAVAAFAEELVARRGFVRAPAAAGGAPGGASQREKQRQRAARLKQGDSEKAPLNCL